MTRKNRNTAAVLKLEMGSRQHIAGHRAGRIIELRQGTPVVDYPGNPHGPLLARMVSTVRVSNETVGPNGVEALLVFEEERSDQPVVVGLLIPPGPETSKPLPAFESQREAVIDGRRVVLDAEEEIVLRCGEASITLRKNGRVVIRGVYVETRSKGVNRIKGGTVQIN